MKTVTVVIPTYNRADLIELTLAALVSQTRPADEIIVVDDGSTDGTDAVLARYAPQIRNLRIANSGELVARNSGLREATGDLVGFCDSDDIWEPNCLETLAMQWDKTPGLFACYADFRTLRATGLSSETKFASAPPGFWSGLDQAGEDAGVFRIAYPERLIVFQPFFPSCMMVDRAEFLAAGGWDEGVTGLVGCDLATTLRVSTHPPVGVVRRPLVQIRKHTQNYSANVERMNLGDAEVLDYALRTRRELAPLASLIMASMAQRRGAAMESAFSRLDFAETCRIGALLPRGELTLKQQVKKLIAHFPTPLARLAASALARA
jgi:hypothetical protein